MMHAGRQAVELAVAFVLVVSLTLRPLAAQEALPPAEVPFVAAAELRLNEVRLSARVFHQRDFYRLEARQGRHSHTLAINPLHGRAYLRSSMLPRGGMTLLLRQLPFDPTREGLARLQPRRLRPAEPPLGGASPTVGALAMVAPPAPSALAAEARDDRLRALAESEPLSAGNDALRVRPQGTDDHPRAQADDPVATAPLPQPAPVPEASPTWAADRNQAHDRRTAAPPAATAAPASTASAPSRAEASATDSESVAEGPTVGAGTGSQGAPGGARGLTPGSRTPSVSRSAAFMPVEAPPTPTVYQVSGLMGRDILVGGTVEFTDNGVLRRVDVILSQRGTAIRLFYQLTGIEPRPLPAYLFDPPAGARTMADVAFTPDLADLMTALRRAR